jgi:hypothetical protein
MISEGIEWSLASLPMMGPGLAGTEVPGMVALLSVELAGPCAEAISVDPRRDAAVTTERYSLDRMRNLVGHRGLGVQLPSVVDVPTYRSHCQEQPILASSRQQKGCGAGKLLFRRRNQRPTALFFL